MRQWLRQQPLWVRFQELNREGWWRAFRRVRLQAPILATPPVRTASRGPVEVRALTWRKDWLNLIWTLKTFYRFAEVDYPLFIHDGGLTAGQIARLQQHFPDATVIRWAEADRRITAHLKSRGLARCLDFRLGNPLSRKLFDYFVFSGAERIISIDSDILFFREPVELIACRNGPRKNLFNRDRGHWYCMSPGELESKLGVRPKPRINSGLFLVWRESLDFREVERWLAEPRLHESPWLTEQTIHAMSATLYGVEFLPDAYAVGDTNLPIEDRVCHHYPSAFRHRMYIEGMAYLAKNGFLPPAAKPGGFHNSSPDPPFELRAASARSCNKIA